MEPLRTIDELAVILRVSRSTAFRRKKEDKWPCIRVGTVLLFDEENVKQIIEMYRQQTPPPPKTTPNVGTRANRRRSKQ